MNILVTNDDGYEASGIKILFSVLCEKGHNVYMVAPSENRSAVSSGITMTKPLSIRKAAARVWACSGTPADCVITGIQSDLIDDKIDIVVSGINDGGNIGTDIIYSGTCAAARQGALYGLPGIALSIRFSEDCADSDDCYRRMALFAEKNLRNFILMSESSSFCGFVNVNAYSFSSWKGVRNTTVLSTRHYDDTVDIIQKDGAELVSKFYGKEPVSSCQAESDYYACSNGFISVSCVKVEPVAVEGIDGINFSI